MGSTESKPITNLTIKNGPLGEKVYRVKKNGAIYYVKKNLTPKAIDNYQWATKEGVGAPVKVDYSEGSATIEERIELVKAIQNGMLTKEKAISQVRELQACLEKHRKAHCNVKMENYYYFKSQGQILLIDNGEITDYGKRRLVKTPGENTFIIGGKPDVVGPQTDQKGFSRIINELSRADQ